MYELEPTIVPRAAQGDLTDQIGRGKSASLATLHRSRPRCFCAGHGKLRSEKMG